MAGEHFVPQIFFGLNPMAVSTVILCVPTPSSSGQAQPGDHRAARASLMSSSWRSTRTSTQRRRLEHHRAAHRHDDLGVDLAPAPGISNTSPIMVGATSEGPFPRHPAAAASSPPPWCRALLDNATTMLLVVR